MVVVILLMRCHSFTMKVLDIPLGCPDLYVAQVSLFMRQMSYYLQNSFSQFVVGSILSTQTPESNLILHLALRSHIGFVLSFLLAFFM